MAEHYAANIEAEDCARTVPIQMLKAQKESQNCHVTALMMLTMTPEQNTSNEVHKLLSKYRYENKLLHSEH
jgi:hypothetical protein